jgi:hypothetical protein
MHDNSWFIAIYLDSSPRTVHLHQSMLSQLKLVVSTSSFSCACVLSTTPRKVAKVAQRTHTTCLGRTGRRKSVADVLKVGTVR